MQANACVIGLNPQRHRSRRNGLTFDIDSSQQVGVLGLQRRDQFGDATANRPLQLLFVGLREVFGGDLKSLPCGVAAAIEIDQRVAQQAIKPRRHGFFAANGRRLFDGLHKGGLEDFLGIVDRRHAWAEKVEEPAVILHQRIHDRRR